VAIPLKRGVGVTAALLTVVAALGLVTKVSLLSPATRATLSNVHFDSSFPQRNGQLPEAIAQSGLAFEPNRGQVNPAVKFLARGSGYSLYLTNTGATLSFASSPEQRVRRVSKGVTATGGRNVGTTSITGILRMSFVGANPEPEVRGKDQLPGYINYLAGNDTKRWHTDIPTYSRVFYTSIYSGIDLAYYGAHGQLEYDFIVHPRVDPGLIRLEYDDANSVPLNSQGDLVLSLGQYEITQKKPLIYQEARGKREQIPGKYRILARNEVGLEVGPYDVTRPLVIDPALVFSAVFGSPTSGGTVAAMATDSNENIYVTGHATTPDFPTTPGAFQTSGSGGLDEIFVSKLSADGKQLLYSTYLGGSQMDVNDGLAIAVDSAGQAYVGGNTAALDFPTTAGGFQTKAGSCPNPGGTYCDGFLTELNASGTGLVYSTFVGGTDQDRVQGVTLDSSGNVYLTGQTVSTDFPTTPGAYLTSIPPTLHSHTWAFIEKIDPRQSGSASLVYSTYVGGIQVDATGIAVDATGNAYIVGQSFDTSAYPTTPGAFQTVAGTGFTAFVTKMNPTGSALVYSTFLGGIASSPSGQTTQTGATAVAVDAAGNAYVTGLTYASDFPTTSGAFQSSLQGPNAAFVSKINPVGSALVYSTFIGGAVRATNTVGNSIALDGVGNAYITGSTDSDDFPTTLVTLDALCAGASGDCYTGGPSAFVTELSPSGSSLVFSTFLGGSGYNAGSGVAVDSTTGDILVAGTNGSSDFPKTPGAFLTPGQSVFVTKISPTAPGAAIAISPAVVTFPPQAIGTTTQQTVTLTSRGNAPLIISALSAFTGVGPGAFSQTNNCIGSLAPAAACTITFSFTPSDTINYSVSLTVSDNALDSPHTMFLTGVGGTPLATLSATNLTFASQVLNTPSAPQTISVTNTGSAEIQFTSVASTGDFSQTNTCVGSPLMIGQSCAISVVFTPTATGSRTGTLSIVDNTSNSAQTVALVGTGADFSVSAASTSATVTAGQSASYTLSVAPLGGFNQAVSLACSGAPRGANCMVSPSSVTPNGTSATSATVTVSTMARSVLVPVRRISFREPLVPLVALVSTTLLLFFLATRFERSGTRVGLAFCLIAVVFLGAAGCGGSSSSGTPNSNGTPAGAYSLTVTATAGTATRTTTLQLVVN
jgi:Beta-propeller repeat